MTYLPVAPVEKPSRLRRTTFVALAICIAALLAGLAAVLAYAWSPLAALSAPFTPTAEEGHIAEGHPLTLDDAEAPAIARLDPGLLVALREASAAAAGDGIVFDITSGWRSRGYQQWLMDAAIEQYGSEEVARQYVATPETSHHVDGHAVDIGSVDAQLWLTEHGWQWGLCQIYANERWHFELATDPGGVCPALLPDAAGDSTPGVLQH